MTTRMRVFLSLVCTVFGVIFWTVMSGLPTVIRYGPGVAKDWVGGDILYLLFALPGWIIALPFVMHFEDVSGHKAWIMLAIGTAIGPAFMVVWTMISAHGRFNWQADGMPLFLSFWIGFLTTSSYVIVLLLVGSRKRAVGPEINRSLLNL